MEALALVLAVIPICMLAVAFAFRQYLIGYMLERGKNYATRDDFAVLLQQIKQTTQETELIKVALSKSTWLQQRYWTNRERYFLELLEALTNLEISFANRSHFFLEPGSEHSAEILLDKTFEKNTKEGYEALVKVQKLAGPAAVFLPNAAMTVIDDLLRDHWSGGWEGVPAKEFVTDGLRSASAVKMAILKAAKEQLADGALNEI